jgi:general secretion pathway protein F
MATFFYKAVARGGSLVDGILEGPNDKAVAVQLQEMGLTPIQIGTKKSGRSLKFDFRLGFRRASSKDVMFFTQELSTLVNAGLPLDRSLVICRQLSEKPAVQSLVEDILQGIKQGKTFADSLGAHPEAFSKLYVNMIRAGEVSGSLPLVLDR